MIGLSESSIGDSGKILRLAVLMQTIILLPFVAWFLVTGSVLSRSLLLGGLAFYVPYCWQAWYLRLTQALHVSPAKKVARLYRGEIQKWLMTGVICALAFTKAQPLTGSAFFLVFVGMTLSGWLLPATLLVRQGKNRQ